jgi:hypothetical protein
MILKSEGGLADMISDPKLGGRIAESQFDSLVSFLSSVG